MNLQWTPDGWADYVYWQTEDRKTLRRINKLIKDMLRTPFQGIGKPEPLRYDLSEYWSRRIDDANRIVYTVKGDVLIIVQCRTHYE
ncbi:MAG: Txe/YoeB family addiction module toxin [Veillonellaceae bacterium]|jgi:toxin YoeB|uniref:Txe/YoeB family addiction module toxin n=1 Tax=uncultured Selenomonas sp. TaxID=159275 RepID=UPI0025E28614|nr:Txe/YoeB family addiction module toxin [uncultured Selenomonas sp.]MCI7540412.1 Txe/YoeB family addiction module toxin [Veillonellaceae bacterium]MDD6127735.1 Txe/YoeB family addiction module toxin [Veillonellaceae bacterium]MDD6699191.1 Txe/YoeB family addiction module toxin [Veillonellaceae bacterium]MDY6349068.1 Txe/YoeB family addiction module toxin [Selenomonas sp.]